MTRKSQVATTIVALAIGSLGATCMAEHTNEAPALSKIRVAPDGRSFVTDTGRAFAPFGVNYYRPGTGWAPKVWKKFDANATGNDFARMKELGVNCVRVFLSYGSFYMEPGVLNLEGLAKFDQFLAMAESAGIYVHPTGPDHWEEVPDWAKADRIADEKNLSALEAFWKLFAARYRGRGVIFAYDLRNEPEVSWDTAVMHEKWNNWLQKKYGAIEKLTLAWGTTNTTLRFGSVSVPAAQDHPRSRQLLDYQLFREDIADEWTRRQAAAIKAADPHALVTVGLIQWSVPSLLPRVRHYSGFRPERQARFLDFLEVHFYPLERGAYEYRSTEDEARNLAYLESVAREVARPGKPVVIAEFGWYGGGKPTFDQSKHPGATEAQQARWCRRVIEITEGLAVGWLNWGLYDQPEARDVSQLTGLLTFDGKLKEWGREFQTLAGGLNHQRLVPSTLVSRPALDWELCVTSTAGGNQFREDYFKAFQLAYTSQHKTDSP
jgi:glycosyl hydrolase family 42 (putative beta-galactosidase)